jgi:hypothetical protein
VRYHVVAHTSRRGIARRLAYLYIIPNMMRIQYSGKIRSCMTKATCYVGELKIDHLRTMETSGIIPGVFPWLHSEASTKSWIIAKFYSYERGQSCRSHINQITVGIDDQKPCA